MIQEIQIGIIGSGFAGLGMAIRLKQSGIGGVANGANDFVIFERANSVGGVWRDITYPGCACDVESPLYSLSFVPNPNWSRLFSGQAEIWKYLQDAMVKHDLREKIKFGHEMISAHWNADQKSWRIETSKGSYLCKILICAAGAFNEPHQPELRGIEKFKGKVFHSARWDHDCNLQGKNVAVIGTGASAIQFVPAIQPQVNQLSLFQRTAPWVMPRMDRGWNENQRHRFKRLPWLQKLLRLKYYGLHELFGLTLHRPRLVGVAGLLGRYHLRRSIPDLDLREKLTPHYTMGCKRVLVSDDYYPALRQKNVQVITQSIREILPQAIVTDDGVEHPVDVLIYGTGFKVSEFQISKLITGAHGKTLADDWQKSPRAFLGTTVPHFPNLFFLLGPNTGLGHNSVLLMIETQIEYTLNAIVWMRREKIKLLEVKREREIEYVRGLDEKSVGTVWLSGCRSWYLDSTGRNSTIWPSSVGRFRKTLKFREQDYLTN